MKRFAVEYYKKSDKLVKKIISKEVIRAIGFKEANKLADNNKPHEADGFSIMDITAVY